MKKMNFNKISKIINKLKKSQSEVIGSVLLILLVISAVVLISAFLFPFIKEQLTKGDCYKFNNLLEIKNSNKFSCYDSTTNKLKLQVHMNEIDDKDIPSINGIIIILNTAQISSSYEITPGKSDPATISMTDSTPISLPGSASERVYDFSSITSKPDSAIVYPIINSRKCSDVHYTLNDIPDCL